MNNTVLALFAFGCLFSACGSSEPAPIIVNEDKSASEDSDADSTPEQDIASNTYCYAIDSGLEFSYFVTKYTNGNVFVECEIPDGNWTYSSSRTFIKGQTGADTGACFVQYDLEINTSGGMFIFSLDEDEGTVTYDDDSSASDGVSIALSCSVTTPE